MNIGSVKLDNPTVLAPLAGITNLPFRLLAKEAGCGLVCSEMVSANGLVHGSRKTVAMLKSVPEEKPLSVQIFGSVPALMAEAARIVEAAGADILDINFGCAVKKIIKTGSGVALMQTPEKAEALLKAVRESIRIPLTIKIRTGWDASGQQAFEIAAMAEACGVDAIAVHPRTATQLFRGRADWSIIAALKAKASIPIVGNGDIFTADDAVHMREMTGCDAVMIGRQAIGNPWIFSKVGARIRGEEEAAEDLGHRFDTMVRYLRASVEHFGETRACYMMRSRLGWFVKGLHHSSRFRQSITRISSATEAIQLLRSYQEALQGEAPPMG
ncbi:MAG: tRNA dihydrouridine synthase DusB [Desulfobacterales bacterium]|nr:MAG: tRNA dihydrouridine synthase DusB [Desulfobacterales bacterium]